MNFNTNGGIGTNNGNTIDTLATTRASIADAVDGRRLRYATFFGIIALIPNATPTTAERNLPLSLEELCSKMGQPLSGKGQLGVIISSAYGFFGLPMTPEMILEFVVAKGYTLEQIVPTREAMLDILELPFDKNTVKTTTVIESNKGDGKRTRDDNYRGGRRHGKKNDRNVHYSSNVGDVRSSLINTMMGWGWKNAFAGNTLGLYITAVAPKTRANGVLTAKPYVTQQVAFIGDKLVVVGYMKATIAQVQQQANGFCTREVLHDIHSVEHNVPFSAALNKLTRQGWIDASELGIKDVKSFLAAAANLGFNTVYGTWNDLVAGMNVNNPKIQVGATAIRKLTSSARSGEAITSKDVEQIHDSATQVYDGVETDIATDSYALVGAGAPSMFGGQSFGFGIPTSVGMPQTRSPFGNIPGFGTSPPAPWSASLLRRSERGLELVDLHIA